jgi:predicted esterase YcpF (UPF0227 family)
MAMTGNIKDVRILYCHGLESGPRGRKVTNLKRLFQVQISSIINHHRFIE